MHIGEPLGSEEDRVDEAGRNGKPPVIVAPPGLDIDPEVKAADEVVENEGMSSSWQEDAKAPAEPAAHDAHDAPAKRDDAAAGNGSGRRAEPATRVPFPADTIGKPKDAGDGAGGTTASGGVLDSGRQAVRSAVTATNSLFGGRTAKRDGAAGEEAPAESADQGEGAGSAGSPSAGKPPAPTVQGPIMAPPVRSDGTPPPSMFSPGERRPSFSPAAPSSRTTADPSGTTADPSRTTADPSAPPRPSRTAGPSSAATQPGSGGQSLWREVRPPSPPNAASAPGARTPSGQPGALGFSTGGAASAVSGAAAGLAGSVASALQGRREPGGKRRRQAGVRRSPRRQAQLTLARVEPWSVMKFSFVVSVVAFIILFVAVAVLYMVLSALGVFTSLQHTVSTITSSQGTAGTNISGWFSASRILGYTGMLGALNIVLITAMSTIGAVIYNLIATTIGGVEVTLRETE